MKLSFQTTFLTFIRKHILSVQLLVLVFVSYFSVSLILQGSDDASSHLGLLSFWTSPSCNILKHHSVSETVSVSSD
jgi:hypothetical protein